MNTTLRASIIWGMSLCAMVLLGSGLAARGAPAAKTPRGFIFYPPSPAEPRLQFLVSYSTDADLGGGPGKFASFIAGKDLPRTRIVKPYGLSFHQGKLYVCDTGGRSIRVLDIGKKKMTTISPEGPGGLRTPINIAMDTDGTRYITDTGRGQVVIYSKEGAYLGVIEGPPAPGSTTTAGASTNRTAAAGTPPEMRPTDVAITSNRVYVADVNNHCVRVFDKTGRKQIQTIPKDPKDEKEKLLAPVNLTLDGEGRLYVSDFGAFRVQVYDREGNYLRSCGQPGDRPGEFARPKGVAVDAANRLYVVDAALQVVQIFNADSQLLTYFGEPGASEASLNLPAKVLVDYDHVKLFDKYVAPDFQVEHLVIVSNQLGERKVSVYGFGHKK